MLLFLPLIASLIDGMHLQELPIHLTCSLSAGAYRQNCPCLRKSYGFFFPLALGVWVSKKKKCGHNVMQARSSMLKKVKCIIVDAVLSIDT